MPIDFSKIVLAVIVFGIFLLILTFLPFWLGIIIIAILIFLLWKKFFP
ncbi:hypothetical protein HYW55_03860 [Candidatus Gottesmanbacteria bacterium]|nr:hypothetical protein [Candidatus Gottesmanbacteria bacterium]